MASLISKKRKKGMVYYILDRVGGKKVWKTLGVISKSEAKTVLLRYEMDKTYGNVGLKKKDPVTFEKCVQFYFEWAPQYKARITIKNEKHIIKQVSERLNGKQLIHKVSVEDLEATYTKQKYKPNTVKLFVCAIRSLFKFAHDRGDTTENVALKLKRPKLPILPPKSVSKDVIMKIFSVMTPENGFKKETRAKYLLLLYTGMRPGEMLRLQVRDISLIKKEITVRYSKTRRFRVIPISSKIEAILTELTKEKGANDYLFPSPKYPDKPQVEFHCKAVKRAAKKAGVDSTGISPYMFRHQFATTLLNATNNLRLVQQILGHSTLQMTTRYATACDSAIKDAVENTSFGDL